MELFRICRLVTKESEHLLFFFFGLVLKSTSDPEGFSPSVASDIDIRISLPCADISHSVCHFPP